MLLSKTKDIAHFQLLGGRQAVMALHAKRCADVPCLLLCVRCHNVALERAPLRISLLELAEWVPMLLSLDLGPYTTALNIAIV